MEFAKEDLRIILTALDTEIDFLRTAERHGTNAIRQKAFISALQLKIISMAEEIERKEKGADKPELKKVD